MAKYSDELKSRALSKMMPPYNRGISQLAEETGIPFQTLYNWRNKAK